MIAALSVNQKIINSTKIDTYDLKNKISEFIEEKVSELEEDGTLCYELCEEEDDFHMTTYWLSSIYEDSMEFIKKHFNKNYTQNLYKEIFNMYNSYPNSDIRKLELKCKSSFKKGDFNAYLAYEALASIMLREFQEVKVWQLVYGCENNDMIDMYNKYHISNAYTDPDFPVAKLSDVSAAMMGSNFTVQSSNLYDVFAYNADDLQKDEKLQHSLFDSKSEKEKIFTPNTIQYEAIVSRYKHFKNIDKNPKVKKSDLLYYYEAFENIEVPSKENSFSKFSLENKKREFAGEIITLINSRYMYEFCETPYSFQLKDENVVIDLDQSGPEIRIYVCLNIEGIQDKKNTWKKVYEDTWDLPKTPETVQEFVINLAEAFKTALAGKEKEKYSKEPAIEGAYPRKSLATHGLSLDKNKITLSLAEQQSLYILKQALLHSKKPVLSCSFGMDSVLVLHLLRRITKTGVKILWTDTYNEYSETIALKDKLIKEWGICNDLIVMHPLPGINFFSIKDKNGWNFEGKSSRTEHERSNGSKDKGSNSEACCEALKHEPMRRAIAQYEFDLDFSGLRGLDEGYSRFLTSKRDGVIYYAATWGLIRSNPIVFFSQKLVDEYYKYYSIPKSEIYNKILYDDNGKVLYRPRTGCWACMVTAKRGYLKWLKEFKPKQYWFLMNNQGLARTLFAMGMKYKVIKKVPKNPQISLFDTLLKEEKEEDSTISFSTITEEKLNSLDVYYLENLIQWRPCIFQDNIGSN